MTTSKKQREMLKWVAKATLRGEQRRFALDLVRVSGRRAYASNGVSVHIAHPITPFPFTGDYHYKQAHTLAMKQAGDTVEHALPESMIDNVLAQAKKSYYRSLTINVDDLRQAVMAVHTSEEWPQILLHHAFDAKTARVLFLSAPKLNKEFTAKTQTIVRGIEIPALSNEEFLASVNGKVLLDAIHLAKSGEYTIHSQITNGREPSPLWHSDTEITWAVQNMQCPSLFELGFETFPCETLDDVVPERNEPTIKPRTLKALKWVAKAAHNDKRLGRFTGNMVHFVDGFTRGTIAQTTNGKTLHRAYVDDVLTGDVCTTEISSHMCKEHGNAEHPPPVDELLNLGRQKPHSTLRITKHALIKATKTIFGHARPGSKADYNRRLLHIAYSDTDRTVTFTGIHKGDDKEEVIGTCTASGKADTTYHYAVYLADLLNAINILPEKELLEIQATFRQEGGFSGSVLYDGYTYAWMLAQQECTTMGISRETPAEIVHA